MLSLLAAYLLSLLLLVGILTCVMLLRATDVVSSVVSRKLVHILTGSSFLATLPFYPPSNASRFLAATLPAGVAVLFAALAALPPNAFKTTLSRTLSRSGNFSELLAGPFVYGLVMSIVTAVFWRDSPSAVIAIVALCIGDGIAELAGACGVLVLPSPFGRKTLLGCVAFFVGTLLVSLLFELFFFSTAWPVNTLLLAAISCLAEFLSPSAADNVVVVAVVLLCGVLLPWS